MDRTERNGVFIFNFRRILILNAPNSLGTNPLGSLCAAKIILYMTVGTWDITYQIGIKVQYSTPISQPLVTIKRLVDCDRFL